MVCPLSLKALCRSADVVLAEAHPYQVAMDDVLGAGSAHGHPFPIGQALADERDGPPPGRVCIALHAADAVHPGEPLLPREIADGADVMLCQLLEAGRVL